jgi:DNA-binding NarL/FixJ family response regulator
MMDAEREALEAVLRSPVASTVRRAQIVLARARGEHVPAIARSSGYGEQTVRNALHVRSQPGT